MGLMYAVLALPLVLEGVDEWDEAWARVNELEALRAADGDELDQLGLVLELLSQCKKQADDPRFEVLDAWSLRATSTPQTRPASALPEVHGDASWLLADLLEDGPRRTEAYVRALREGTRPPVDPWLTRAWEYGVRCARQHLWLDHAIEVQRELHAIYDQAWSALNLAGSLHRAGRVVEADAVLAAQEPLAPNPAEIQNTRGIHALGRGDERSARDHLGRSLARGYTDSALVLARLEMTRGDLPGARAGFRALLPSDSLRREMPHAWALRGWGMSLLSPEDRR